MRVARVRALRLGRREARRRPRRRCPRPRGRRRDHGGPTCDARASRVLRRVRALSRRPRVDVRAVRGTHDPARADSPSVVRAQAWVDLPEDWPDWRGTIVEPLACVLRGARRVPSGRILDRGERVHRAVVRSRARAARGRRVRRRCRAPACGARAGRAGRRCRPLGPWWRRHGARIRDARRHGARLRRRRAHTGVGGLSPRADRRRDALGRAFVHARGPCAAP